MPRPREQFVAGTRNAKTLFNTTHDAEILILNSMPCKDSCNRLIKYSNSVEVKTRLNSYLRQKGNYYWHNFD